MLLFPLVAQRVLVLNDEVHLFGGVTSVPRVARRQKQNSGIKTSVRDEGYHARFILVGSGEVEW